jgi:hypothetical protein
VGTRTVSFQTRFGSTLPSRDRIRNRSRQAAGGGDLHEAGGIEWEDDISETAGGHHRHEMNLAAARDALENVRALDERSAPPSRPRCGQGAENRLL